MAFPLTDEVKDPTTINTLVINFWVNELVLSQYDDQTGGLLSEILSRTMLTPLINFNQGLNDITKSIVNKRDWYDAFCSMVIRGRLYDNRLNETNLLATYVKAVEGLMRDDKSFESFLPERFIENKNFASMLLLGLRINHARITVDFFEKMRELGLAVTGPLQKTRGVSNNSRRTTR